MSRKSPVARVSVLYLETGPAGDRHWYALAGIGGLTPSYGVSGAVPDPGDRRVGARVWVKDELAASGPAWLEFVRSTSALARYRPAGSRIVSPGSGSVASTGRIPRWLDATDPAGARNLTRLLALGGRLAGLAPDERVAGNGIEDLLVPQGASAPLDGTIPFAALPAVLRDDPDLLGLLERERAEPLEALRFRPTTVTLRELGDLIASPEAYLESPEDPEGEYDRVIEMAELYYRRGVEALPPVVLARRRGSWWVLDGAHRLSAAVSVGIEELPAFVLA